MKTVRIDALFPDLPAKIAEQSASATATGVVTALARALRELLKRDGIKGRRLHGFRLTVYVSNGEKGE